MQLIMAAASPFARKVRVLIRETNQLKDVEEVHIETSPFNANPIASAANPTARIPSLTRPDGSALYDSRVITRYLDARAQAGLYPDSNLWDVLALEATGDGIMDSAVSISYETRLRSREMVSADWVNAQWVKIMGGCTAIQDRSMAHLNSSLNMGQISVACALGYLDLRHDARQWRHGHKLLADWFSGFQERASMIDTYVKG